MERLKIDDLARMVSFARVVELGAFSRAARDLGLTTSSVSQHVRTLEASLNATLLNRTTRKLSLTEAGALFYAHCAEIARSAADAEQSVATLHNRSVGDIRIAVSTFISTQYLVPALDGFLKQNPNVRIFLQVSDHKVDLVEERVDFAFRVGKNRKPEDVYLGRLDGVLCAAPEYLDSHLPISVPSDLLRHDFVFFTPHGEPSTLEMTHRDGDIVRIKLQPRICADHTQSIKMLVMNGHGIARLLRPIVAGDLADGRLRAVLPEWSLERFDVFLQVRHKGVMPMKVAQCLDHIRSHFERVLQA